VPKTLGIDFDGVVHRYSRGWQDGTIYDPPVDGALDALIHLRTLGYRLALYTTRAREPERIEQIRQWLAEYGFPATLFDEITASKPLAVAYIDDRAIRFYTWPQALADVLDATV
jgi:hypothetical protein